MADVLLRDYIDLLREHLHAGKHSDAFALGQHILHYFPKHVETYVLLAQASLEINDLSAATDLFRRVLSADPENVLALAGMALLAETLEKYDDALWYLERAYEVQPSNDDLRRELLRVRELFYGTAPARLELTSGALARVYARQGQYAHAVNEYRRLLRNDSKRYDARVGLAEALYHAGRTDEAAQTAQSVMADAPYALKPNLILGYLWSENAVPEGQQFLRRAQQLDPENRVARELLGEKFGDGQSPRLPPLGERAHSLVLDDEAIGVVSTASFTPDAASARAAEFLRELERAQEPEEPELEDEPLFADLDVLSLVESITPAPIVPDKPQVVSAPPVEGPAAPVTDVAAPPSVAEIAAPTESLAVQSQETEIAAPTSAPTPTLPISEPPPPATTAAPSASSKKQSDFASRLTRTRGNENLTPDSIAAAANALATSIALDKSNQPTPTLRTHPAIPKVRPVIRGVAERLPTWLRLGATPAASSGSMFDLPSPTDETPAPVKAAVDDRPAWLVEAQAAATQETVQAQVVEPDLPDWLQTGGHTDAPKPTDTEPAKPEVPAWLRNELEAARAAQNPTVQAQTDNTTALPEWLKDETAAPPAPVPPASSEPQRPPLDIPIPTQSMRLTPQAFKSSEPPAPPKRVPDAPAEPVVVPQAKPKTLPPAAEVKPTTPAPSEPAPVVEERAPTQAMPDSATMLQMARDKRDSGDLKGALDLYERVMHRRPNYLDQLTDDLKAIIAAGNAPTSANRLLGEAYAMAGKFKESLEQYRIAMGK